jgi:hypothetical protein
MRNPSVRDVVDIGMSIAISDPLCSLLTLDQRLPFVWEIPDRPRSHSDYGAGLGPRAPCLEAKKTIPPASSQQSNAHGFETIFATRLADPY